MGKGNGEETSNHNLEPNTLICKQIKMENIFYLDANRQKNGPLKDSELLGRGVTASTLVWMPGLTQWTPAGQVPQLAYLFNGQPSPVAAEQPAAEQPVYHTETTEAGTEPAYAATEQSGAAVQQVVVNTESPTNVCGAIGMTLAILLFVLWIPGVGLAIAWLVALIFSIIGVCRPKKGMAIAGLIITVLLLLAGIISLIFGFTLLKSLF